MSFQVSVAARNQVNLSNFSSSTSFTISSTCSTVNVTNQPVGNVLASSIKAYGATISWTRFNVSGCGNILSYVVTDTASGASITTSGKALNKCCPLTRVFKGRRQTLCCHP